jgi:hypothetical protein
MHPLDKSIFMGPTRVAHSVGTVTHAALGVASATKGSFEGNNSWQFRGKATVVFNNNAALGTFQNRFRDLNDGPLQIRTKHFRVKKVTADNGSTVLDNTVKKITVLCETKFLGIKADSTTVFDVYHDEDAGTLTFTSDKIALPIRGKLPLHLKFGLFLRESTEDRPPTARLGLMSRVNNHIWLAGALRTTENEFPDPHGHLQEEAQKIGDELSDPKPAA